MSVLDRIVIEGDCVEAMAAMAECSVDAVVCDPPYGLEFMGKDWDRLSGQPGYNERGRITDRPGAQVPYGRGGGVNSYQAGQPMQEWHEVWAREALRVLKPGGHLLAAGGSRTFHRLVCGLEDAGFEIRDCITHHYGNGFPKSLSVSKAIDKAAGAEREVVGRRRTSSGGMEALNRGNAVLGYRPADYSDGENVLDVTTPATSEAQRWDGFGTALKPATEFWTLARKPLMGTVVANVLAHGSGALNIDGCRVVFADSADEREPKGKNRHADFGSGPRENAVYGEDNRARGESGNYDPPGRWPANVVFSHHQECHEVGLRFVKGDNRDTGDGTRPSGFVNVGAESGDGEPNALVYGDAVASKWACHSDCPIRLLDEQTGGASRFFYCAKPSRREKSAGLPDGERSSHPTVKPVALMGWFVRLVTPPGGLILDPFCGSGTTGIAAVQEGFRFIGIEREPEYARIARARIEFAARELQEKAAA